MSAPAHRNNLDALRLILAVLVLFSHSFPLAGDEAAEPLAWWTGGRADLGSLAVGWFFAFSGYLIAASWVNSPSMVVFLRRRAARLYPGYLAALAVCWLVVIPAVGGPAPGASWGDAARAARDVVRFRMQLRAPGLDANPFPSLVDGSLWSLSFEAWCYLGIVGMGLAGLLARRGAVLALYLAALAGAVAVIDLRIGSSRYWGRGADVFGDVPHWAQLLPHFLAGTCAYSFRDRLRFTRGWAMLALAGLMLMLPFPLGRALASPTLGVYLAFYLAFTTDWRWPALTRRGDFSYGVYVYGWPVQQLIMAKSGGPIAPLRLFALALGPTLLLGVASWFLVERHFLGSRRMPRSGAGGEKTDG